ncbi:MAG: hypothetical protein K6G26_06260, partial [Lachnospiraceae bacterium]|nr:hypothetical protein [Lachnospiraceae bacterium]
MGYSSILKLINQGDFSEAKKRMNEYIDGNEVNEEDLKLLIDYYNATNSLFAGRILYRIQCSMGKYFDAYETFVSLLSKTMRKELSLADCVELADLPTVERMTEDIIEKLEDDLDIPQSLIVSQIYDILEPKLYAAKQEKDYELIARMANNIWFEELKSSHYLYETAKSCIKVKDPLAEKVLQKM